MNKQLLYSFYIGPALFIPDCSSVARQNTLGCILMQNLSVSHSLEAWRDGQRPFYEQMSSHFQTSSHFHLFFNESFLSLLVLKICTEEPSFILSIKSLLMLIFVEISKGFSDMGINTFFKGNRLHHELKYQGFIISTILLHPSNRTRKVKVQKIWSKYRN